MAKQKGAKAGKGKGKVKVDAMVPQQNAGSKGRKEPKVKEQEQWVDDLGRSLTSLGLRIKTVAADGNCFFRACSDQLQENEGQHLDLRRRIVQFMREHSDDFMPYMEDDEDFDAYCNRMQKDGTWAGLHEQVAAARLHGVELRIYQEGQPCWTIHPEFSEIPKNAPAWHLSYHDGQHYNSVRLAHDFEAAPPTPIPVLDGRIVPSSEVSAAAAESEQQRRLHLSAVTGCSDEAWITEALADAKGVEDQAIELIIDRMATDSWAEEDEPVPTDNQQFVGTAEGEAVPDGQQGKVPQDVAVQASSFQPTAATEAESALSDSEEQLGWAAEPVAMKGKGMLQPVVQGGLGDELGATPEEAQGLKKESKARRAPAKRKPCPCGSNRKYRDCCGRKGARQKLCTAPELGERSVPGLYAQAASLYI